jgi:hypothetical protein
MVSIMARDATLLTERADRRDDARLRLWYGFQTGLSTGAPGQQ